MIYFAMFPGGSIKIGMAKNVRLRMAQLKSHFGVPLRILATTEGERAQERETHQRFDHLRFPGTEQFRPAADLMAFIGKSLPIDINPDIVQAHPPASPVDRRIGLTLTSELIQSLRVLSLFPATEQEEANPVAEAKQIASVILYYAGTITRATRELGPILDYAEWNLLAQALKGLVDLSSCSITLIRNQVEDGHRLDGLGYKWFGEDDRKASDAKVKALLAKLGKLTSVHGDAIMAAVRHFWRHTEIDHSEERWWTVKARMA